VPPSRFDRHVFVCTHSRPEGGKPSCGARGGLEIHAALTRAVATDPALCGRVAVSTAGCLGPCFDGPNAVVYPDGAWYAELTTADVEPLVEAQLRRGEPLASRLYDWPSDDGD
jgi:(2Fe-2S) ferredoxin